MTSHVRPVTSLLVALSLAGLLLGCAGDADPDDATPSASPSSTAAPTADSTTAPAASTTAPTTTDGQDTAATVPETTERAPSYPAMVTTEAASGSNPTLSWTPVDGAALYRLVVLDPDGRPYWAWSGTETAVPVGGNSTPTGSGARVFGDMTWQVAALAPDGTPLAMSDRGRLSP